MHANAGSAVTPSRPAIEAIFFLWAADRLHSPWPGFLLLSCAFTWGRGFYSGSSVMWGLACTTQVARPGDADQQASELACSQAPEFIQGFQQVPLKAPHVLL